MPFHPPLPKAPEPKRIIFDPFNSSSTGHQRAENRLSGSTSWRDSRSYKLAHQFRDTSGRGGQQHLSDLVGAGSKDYGKDGRKDNGSWDEDAPGLREQGWQDIRCLMPGSRKRRREDIESENREDKLEKKRRLSSEDSGDVKEAGVSQLTSCTVDKEKFLPTPKQPPQIFRGLTIYLNGSTAPLVSDHRLKQIFAQHGGNSSISLGRRTVTHVILGKTCGGGLASGKIHKEVSTVGGKGIRYVTAQWVLDSVEKGIRQLEGKYMPPDIATRIGGSRQRSVKTLLTSSSVG